MLERLKSAARILRSKMRRKDPPEVTALYRVLYDQVHDLDEAREIRPLSTRESFAHQWTEHPTGEYLLSDPWFKKNVDRILCEQELLIDRSWFKGKKVLDAGCGNGRWAYGFSKLGADLTCVDQAESALRATAAATAEFSNLKRFVRTPLENLSEKLPGEQFDLVFSWGVLHHCVSYTKALKSVTSVVKPGGILYLYLYGRESLPIEKDIETFKERVVYNVLMTHEERKKFLLRMAKGDPNKVHNFHDIYAPLINRRFTFDEVKKQLAELGFTNFQRTISHSEVFIRATNGIAKIREFELAPKKPPYWFQGHHI